MLRPDAMAPRAVPRAVNAIADRRLETVEPGDQMVTNDHQTRYHTELHDNGSVTMRRAVPKLSKAQKKALKRARRR